MIVISQQRWPQQMSANEMLSSCNDHGHRRQQQQQVATTTRGREDLLDTTYYVLPQCCNPPIFLYWTQIKNFISTVASQFPIVMAAMMSNNSFYSRFLQQQKILSNHCSNYMVFIMVLKTFSKGLQSIIQQTMCSFSKTMTYVL